MKVTFLTIEIDDRCYDLPHDMQIPQKESVVHIEGKSGIVENINYHIVNGKVYMVSIYCRKSKP